METQNGWMEPERIIVKSRDFKINIMSTTFLFRNYTLAKVLFVNCFILWLALFANHHVKQYKNRLKASELDMYIHSQQKWKPFKIPYIIIENYHW